MAANINTESVRNESSSDENCAKFGIQRRRESSAESYEENNQRSTERREWKVRSHKQGDQTECNCDYYLSQVEDEKQEETAESDQVFDRSWQERFRVFLDKAHQRKTKEGKLLVAHEAEQIGRPDWKDDQGGKSLVQGPQFRRYGQPAYSTKLPAKRVLDFGENRQPETFKHAGNRRKQETGYASTEPKQSSNRHNYFEELEKYEHKEKRIRPEEPSCSGYKQNYSIAWEQNNRSSSDDEQQESELVGAFKRQSFASYINTIRGGYENENEDERKQRKRSERRLESRQEIVPFPCKLRHRSSHEELTQVADPYVKHKSLMRYVEDISRQSCDRACCLELRREYLRKNRIKAKILRERKRAMVRNEKMMQEMRERYDRQLDKHDNYLKKTQRTWKALCEEREIARKAQLMRMNDKKRRQDKRALAKRLEEIGVSKMAEAFEEMNRNIRASFDIKSSAREEFESRRRDEDAMEKISKQIRDLAKQEREEQEKKRRENEIINKMFQDARQREIQQRAEAEQQRQKQERPEGGSFSMRTQRPEIRSMQQNKREEANTRDRNLQRAREVQAKMREEMRILENRKKEELAREVRIREMRQAFIDAEQKRLEEKKRIDEASRRTWENAVREKRERDLKLLAMRQKTEMNRKQEEQRNALEGRARDENERQRRDDRQDLRKADSGWQRERQPLEEQAKRQNFQQDQAKARDARDRETNYNKEVPNKTEYDHLRDKVRESKLEFDRWKSSAR